MEAGRVEETGVAEVVVAEDVDGTELAHLVVEVDEVAVFVVEGHGDEAVVEEPLELAGEFGIGGEFLLTSAGIFVGNVLGQRDKSLTVGGFVVGSSHGWLTVVVPDCM